ncbi:polysaccharide biosynthesis protein [Sediminivirga luteola]|uniref:polysaccharide biosynthesis protein n=1 Tax=Sediminivirga luteola TaxID=1774748 RepID=UPI001F5622C0|nr:nucleoside-diphosphate sugar epimerase/dehydratase [Sediminivirga luteola]MCI2266951.1 polysaccharide biosynthesis protein [Sediminivirga luteola]
MVRLRKLQLVLSQMAIDAIAWWVALAWAIWARYDFAAVGAPLLPLIVVGLLVVVAQIVIGLALWLYRGRYRYGSFQELRSLFVTAMMAAAAVGLPVIALGNDYGLPRSTVLLAVPYALVLMAGVRYLRRTFVEGSRRPRNGAEPALVYGAGQMGDLLLRSLTTDPRSAFRPVGLLDDDPAKRNLQLHGVKNVGTFADLDKAVADTGAKALIVSIARPSSEFLRRVQDSAASNSLRVLVLPSISDSLAGTPHASDLRDINIEDLIGRQPVDTDVSSIASYVKGKRILVTGAGGSIGSELCRQLSVFEPSELIMFDRDETGLQLTQLAVSGHGLLHTNDVVLGDIRDALELERLFLARRPDVVFHAAALKHLPMLEQYPEEAWKTNVLGTLNVLEAARAAEVETFVNISTDKAANPTSVLGHSKRVAEKITAWMGKQTGKRYISVRFGNVIGSRGSMLPTFTSLIESGGPLTVTHPEATRFFMTIPEACQLVVQAGAIGRTGEVLILDMGEPVRILDIAKRMIAMSGKKIDIVFTGLREGEKLHEDLIGASESDERPFHPKITHATVSELAPVRMRKDEWLARLTETVEQTQGTVQGKDHVS